MIIAKRLKVGEFHHFYKNFKKIENIHQFYWPKFKKYIPPVIFIYISISISFLIFAIRSETLRTSGRIPLISDSSHIVIIRPNHFGSSERASLRCNEIIWK